jgi:hypothetical protein
MSPWGMSAEGLRADRVVSDLDASHTGLLPRFITAGRPTDPPYRFRLRLPARFADARLLAVILDRAAEIYGTQEIWSGRPTAELRVGSVQHGSIDIKFIVEAIEGASGYVNAGVLELFLWAMIGSRIFRSGIMENIYVPIEDAVHRWRTRGRELQKADLDIRALATKVDEHAIKVAGDAVNLVRSLRAEQLPLSDSGTAVDDELVIRDRARLYSDDWLYTGRSADTCTCEAIFASEDGQRALVARIDEGGRVGQTLVDIDIESRQEGPKSPTLD